MDLELSRVDHLLPPPPKEEEEEDDGEEDRFGFFWNTPPINTVRVDIFLLNSGTVGHILFLAKFFCKYNLSPAVYDEQDLPGGNSSRNSSNSNIAVGSDNSCGNSVD